MKITTFNLTYKEAFTKLYQKTFLESPVYKEIWTNEEVEEVLNRDETFLLLDDEDSLGGFICGRSYTKFDKISDAETTVITQENKVLSYYISELVIDEEYRGKGLGEKLVKHLLTEKINEGKINFLIHTRLNNPVRSLYERLGFSSIIDHQGEIIITETESNTVEGKGKYKGLYLSFSLPNLQNLKETFDFIKVQTYQNVRGVVAYDTGKTGKTLGITMCTHGDEPAGLAILWYFLKNNFWSKIKHGKVIFILQNMAATQNYFKDYTSPTRNDHRFLDVNFNRLPENSHEIEGADDYEVKRLQELYPIYQEFDYGFDIHTSGDEKPMIIAGDKFYPELVKGFPIETVLTNIAIPQIGFPSFQFFGGLERNIPVFEIEAGTDESPKSFKMAIDCAIALLTNLNMIKGEMAKAVDSYKEYFIYDTVVFKNESFELSKYFEYYEPLKTGQILAKGMIDEKEVKIICKEEGHAIFPPVKKLKSSILSEEQMFISKAVKVI